MWILAALLGLGGLGALVLHPKGADTPLSAPRLTPLPAGTTPVTIALLGSSLSTGDWPQVAAEQLSTCAARPVEMLQITRGGATSRWGLTQVDKVIAAAPDIVLVEFTINDADLRRRLSRADSTSLHRQIVSKLQTALPEARVILLRLSRAHGLRAALRPLQARYDKALEEIAQDTGTGLIDLRPLWADAPSATRPDNLHPTPEAARTRNAPGLTKALAPLLEANCS